MKDHPKHEQHHPIIKVTLNVRPLPKQSLASWQRMWDWLLTPPYDRANDKQDETKSS